jgi:hypothetical protein
MIRKGQANSHRAPKEQKVILQAAVTQGNDPEAPLKLAILVNAIAEGDFEQKVEVPIELTDSENTTQQRMANVQGTKCLNIDDRHFPSFLDSAPNSCRTRRNRTRTKL